MAPNDSEDLSVEMSTVVFGALNLPLSAICILLNLFAVFCLIIPLGSERLKAPLNILLGSLIGNNIVLYLLNFAVALCESVAISLNQILTGVVEDIMVYLMAVSVTSTIWLNVFYYFQIVPAQRPVFIWLKKNIRVFIYSALIMDRLLFLLGLITNIVYIIKNSQKDATNTDTPQDAADTSMDFLINALIADVGFRLAYFIPSLCVMSSSSLATVLYLWRHMESMKESSSTSSSLQLRAQLRVTITGIVQALLYLLCSVLVITNEIFSLEFPELELDRHIMCTVVSLYTLLTTINVGVGQSIFRQRAIHIYQKLFQTISS